MTDTSIAIAAIGIVATSVAALIWITKYLLVELKRSTDRNTAASIKVAKATDRNTAYLKERNGRDSEVHKELLKQMQANTKVLYSIESQRTKESNAILEAIAKIHIVKQQKVETQVVKTQEIQ